VHAPREGATDEEVEGHAACLSNIGSTSNIGVFPRANRSADVKHRQMSACGERKGTISGGCGCY
jgi:hypothetical protein